MASSGSYNMSSSYGTIRVEWWVISQSTSGNYTRVGWRAVATWASNTWLQVYSCNIWINGAQVLARGSAQTWGGQFANGEINIGHNNDGTKVFGSNGNAAIYTAATNASGSGAWDLPTIARWAGLTAISMDAAGIAATDESALWLEFSNPAGISVGAFVEIIVGGTTTGIFNNTGVGSRHNFAVSPTSAAAIQSAMANTASATIRIGIYSTVGGETRYDYRDRTITIANGSGQANPIFTDFSYKDSNAATVAITGNDQYIIQGYSTLQATVLAADKMVAQKLATPSNYRYQIGSIDVTEPYATTDVVKELGVVGVNTSTPLVVTARDSRNFSKAVSETVSILPYLAPQLSGTAQRVNNFETSTKISISGVISQLTIGGVDKNAVNTTNGLQYRYKKTDTGTWGAWQNITSSTSGANVSMTDFYVNLDRNFAWNVEFRLTDKITSTSVALIVSVGIPIFRIGADGKVYNNEEQLATQAFLKTKMLGYNKHTTNQGGFSNTLTAINGATSTVVVPAGVELLTVELSLALFNTTSWSTDQWRLFLFDGSTDLQYWVTIPESYASAGFGYTPFAKFYIENPTAGTHTYNIKIQRTNGSGTGATNADSKNPVVIMVKIEK